MTEDLPITREWLDSFWFGGWPTDMTSTVGSRIWDKCRVSLGSSDQKQWSVFVGREMLRENATQEWLAAFCRLMLGEL